MKTSEIKSRGKLIINTVFASVWTSRDKEVWKKAIGAARQHVAKLQAGNDPVVTWSWESALNQLARKFGEKFIKKS